MEKRFALSVYKWNQRIHAEFYGSLTEVYEALRGTLPQNGLADGPIELWLDSHGELKGHVQDCSIVVRFML
jgi:hypothetical protein